MQLRNNSILNSREPFFGTITNCTNDEKFQNITLRPILKFQNELLLLVFKNYIVKQKNVFFELSPDKKMNYIENCIQKDMKFRNVLKGIIIGMFTDEEFNQYIQNSSSLNKRMMNLVIERYKSQVLLFEKNN